MCYYNQVQEPALANRSYSRCVDDFTRSAILAYECGYNERSLQEQVAEALANGDSGLRPGAAEGFDSAACVAATALVWLTLMLSPRTVQRWATASPLSDETLAAWKGFVGMIVHAYFERRMAWYPVDRLSMEMAAMGQPAEAPDLVAERARLVFTTLERVHPQFPSD